jgi:hypothetical protein
VTAAEFITASLVASGAVGEWTQSGAVSVDAEFQRMSLEHRKNACQALDIVRQTKGLKSGFAIRDAASNRKIGRFTRGRLHMKP